MIQEENEKGNSSKSLIRIDETLELDPEEDYPFRASLIKVARCGMCQNGVRQPTPKDGDLTVGCKKGCSLIYPLIANEHSCEEYVYFPDIIMDYASRGKILTFVGLLDQRKECKKCGHLLYGKCSGLQWYPFKIKEDKCEFFRDRKLTCKYAVPFLQYNNHHRNNYCTLPPDQRDGDQKRGWKWCCSSAHEKNAEYSKCYEPREIL